MWIKKENEQNIVEWVAEAEAWLIQARKD
jgi:hypothetical protein